VTAHVGGMVEVCIFRIRNSVPEVLLLRRAADEDRYPGIWQNVTGTVHDGEDSIAAAKRELKEETGLAPVRFWVVPHISSFYDRTRDLVVSVPLFAAEVGVEASPVLSREHDLLAWLPFSEAASRLVWPGQRSGLDIVLQYIVGGGAASRLSEIPVL
jgi:dATP pyrophosphohydrolase